jgi:hypothetical protein
MFGFGSSPTLIVPRSVELFDPANLAFRITTSKLPDGVSNVGYTATVLETAGGAGATRLLSRRVTCRPGCR